MPVQTILTGIWLSTGHTTYIIWVSKKASSAVVLKASTLHACPNHFDRYIAKHRTHHLHNLGPNRASSADVLRPLSVQFAQNDNIVISKVEGLKSTARLLVVGKRDSRYAGTQFLGGG